MNNVGYFNINNNSLIYYSRIERLYVVSKLLEYKADYNIQGEEKTTALIWEITNKLSRLKLRIMVRKYVCNPKTNRVIEVGGATYKKVSKNAADKRKMARSPKSSSKENLIPCKSPRRRRKSSKGKKRRGRPRSPVKCGNPKGWSALSPGGHERTVMMDKCGKHCFLGRDKTFPICAAGTCRHNQKGISAACIRGRQMSSPRGKNVKGRSKAYYNRIAQRALALRNASSGGRTYHTHHCQHQGYDDKEDESLGMRTGAEDTKKQTFKDRRDESYGKWGTRGERTQYRKYKQDTNLNEKEWVEVEESGYRPFGDVWPYRKSSSGLTSIEDYGREQSVLPEHERISRKDKWFGFDRAQWPPTHSDQVDIANLYKDRLRVSALRGDLLEVKRLLNFPHPVSLDVNERAERSKNMNETTPLIEAARGGNVEVIDYLIIQGADPNLQDRWGNTALQTAEQQDLKEGKNTPSAAVRRLREIRPFIITEGLKRALENKPFDSNIGPLISEFE